MFSPFDQLPKTPANFQSLTPVTLIERAAFGFPKAAAVIGGSEKITYDTLYLRARRTASALARRGVRTGDVVALSLPDAPGRVEAQIGAAMLGAVTASIDPERDRESLAQRLAVVAPKVIFAASARVETALGAMADAGCSDALLVCDALGEDVDLDLASLIAEGDPAFPWRVPQDEWSALCVAFSQGPDGRVRAAVHSHRAAMIMALTTAPAAELTRSSVAALAASPESPASAMFPWTLAAAASAQLCLGAPSARAAVDALDTGRATHVAAASEDLGALAAAAEDEVAFAAAQRAGASRPDGAEDDAIDDGAMSAREAAAARAGRSVGSILSVGRAPAARARSVLNAVGFNLTHFYGAPETMGPAARDGDARSAAERRGLSVRPRSGLFAVAAEEVEVLDPNTLRAAAADGQGGGELMLRGNVVMKGYLKDPLATERALGGGWLRSGDAATVGKKGEMRVTDAIGRLQAQPQSQGDGSAPVPATAPARAPAQAPAEASTPAPAQASGQGPAWATRRGSTKPQTQPSGPTASDETAADGRVASETGAVYEAGFLSVSNWAEAAPVPPMSFGAMVDAKAGEREEAMVEEFAEELAEDGDARR